MWHKKNRKKEYISHFAEFSLKFFLFSVTTERSKNDASKVEKFSFLRSSPEVYTSLFLS